MEKTYFSQVEGCPHCRSGPRSAARPGQLQTSEEHLTKESLCQYFHADKHKLFSPAHSVRDADVQLAVEPREHAQHGIDVVGRFLEWKRKIFDSTSKNNY